ncbi:hypothetical protein PHJA_001080900 [Phtheirospermum japonicum]|uniref:Uncharacterized protein n=1 Tax=Phtheirospermum japonicum TaxID=374723 RepID=A0A830BTN0_9LAMI|nr:hypothetical protein PHJA_001080900 [Phtheirospermum japonicum]
MTKTRRLSFPQSFNLRQAQSPWITNGGVNSFNLLDLDGRREGPNRHGWFEIEDTTEKKGRGITKGENAEEFKTKASAILKQNAPMQYARWKKIPTDRKKMLWLAMKITVFGIREIVHPLLEALLGVVEVSDRNKQNRDKLKMAHTCGAKSIAQYCYEVVGGVDTEGPVSEDKAFIKVLGPEKPSRLRGCGDGLKPPSKRGESINQELSKE